MIYKFLLILYNLYFLIPNSEQLWTRNHKRLLLTDKSMLIQNCPQVKVTQYFDLEGMMGIWYIIQYYASSEENSEYSCMRSDFQFNENDKTITMNFTYTFADDPLQDKLQGNITWMIPDFQVPAHWVHSEDIYDGIYNTYVLDTDYINWSLIMHCAEKNESPRYLSALLLSREPTLNINAINFLREKLPRYDIDLSFMFSINQTFCDDDRNFENKLKSH